VTTFARDIPVRSLVALACLAWSAIGPALSDEPTSSIRLNPGKGDLERASFEVAGLAPADLDRLRAAKLDASAWAAVFAVSVDDTATPLDPSERTPIVGGYRVSDKTIQFQPRFPLVRGLRYRARFDPSRLNGSSAPGPITALFSLPATVSPRTSVTRVDPSATTVPENLLKFYLHFSAPMSRGAVYKNIHLFGPSGQPVDLPFLELGEELWDSTGTRLTLLIDPGRIKRGLKPREESGPVLEQGKRYALVIDSAWPDANGNPLAAAYTKKFLAGPPDETAPDPKTWRIDLPEVGSTAPLTVRLPEPLDRALLEHVVSLADPAGQVVAGRIIVADDALTWQLRPKHAWTAGSYRLVVETRLEDLAGNSIGRPFEVDLFEPIPEQPSAGGTVVIPFVITGNRTPGAPTSPRR
jgi:hypothetical protein